MKKLTSLFLACTAMALVASSISFQALAQDSFREKIIRGNTMGSDAQERAIQQDRQNRRDNENFNSNLFGSTVNFVNRMEQRAQARSAGEASESCFFCTEDEEKNYQAFRSKGSDQNDIWMKLDNDEPIGKISNYQQRAYYMLEYKLRSSRDNESDGGSRVDELVRRRNLEIAKVQFLLDLREPGVYKPDAKRGLKMLKRMIEEDKEMVKAGKQTGMPQLAFLMGTIYLNGAGVKADAKEALQWFTKAASYKELFLADEDLYGAARKIELATSKYVVFGLYGIVYQHRNGLGVDKSEEKARQFAKEAGWVAANALGKPYRDSPPSIYEDYKTVMWLDVGDMVEQEMKANAIAIYDSLIALPATEYLKAYSPFVAKK